MQLFPASLLAAVQPGAYSVVDTTALVAAQQGKSPRTLAVLGPALGGQPNTPLEISDSHLAKSRLRGGALLDVARLAFQAVGSLTVVRVGTGIAQSTSGTNIKGAAATLALTLTSIGYGAWVNAITFSVTAGVLTIQFTDPLTGVTSKEVYTPTTGTTNANIAANVRDQVNGNVPGIPKSQLVTATTPTTPDNGPLATLVSTAMTGGADNSTLTGTDWTNGLAAIEPYPADFVTVTTDDATVHAQVMQHCLLMSQPLARKERRTVVGGQLGESVAAQATRAQTAAVANRRGQLVYPGVQMFDDAGNLVLYPPSYAASVVAAMHCALPDPATSLVHARLPIYGAELTLSTMPGGAIDQLLQANVSPIAPAHGGGFWLTDSVSLEPTDPNWHDFIKQGSADAVQQALRAGLEDKYTGAKAVQGSTNAVAIDAEKICEKLKLSGVIRDFLQGQTTVAEDPARPGFYAVAVPVMLIDTIRFIPITVALQPASTLTAVTAAAANPIT